MGGKTVEEKVKGKVNVRERWSEGKGSCYAEKTVGFLNE
jgi:hypothetical protein